MENYYNISNYHLINNRRLQKEIVSLYQYENYIYSNDKNDLLKIKKAKVISFESIDDFHSFFYGFSLIFNGF